ncbi:cadherin domain-containing protein [Marinoscillum furvescens]|uniref:Gliding motility-associated-like protein n=1 Tax=Marinoscillum furvescens DSM 4134 TaxID=1122208 RepID=A0A3D9KWQ4_MARFU|nr:cadherin domain-containing protein [Marinoscillum furvescens]RED92320.1 gliding motility-associated-like protein [Marinoscillum furvescens DSM 4134]
MKNVLMIAALLLGFYSQGQAPASWTVDPNDFSHDMTVVARLEMNGRISTSSNDKVAAFIDGTVVGVGSPDVNVPSTGDVVVFLTVHSNSASGKTVTFQLYDDQNNEVLDAVNSLAFQANASTGENTDPYDISDNYAPTAVTLSASAVAENQVVGTVVGTLGSEDQNHTTGFTYALVTGTGDSGNSYFSVDGDEFKTAEVLNFEEFEELSVRLKTTDPKGATAETVFTITISNENDTPTDLTLSASTINENNELFDQVATIATTDEDAGDTFSYQLIGSDDDGDFEIRDNNRLVLGVAADFEVKSSYTLTLRVTDKGGAGATYDETFTINIGDVNETATDITLSNNEVDENSVEGTVIGSFTVTDEDAGDTHSFAFQNGTDSDGNFLLDGAALKIIVDSDFETKDVYFITIVTTDKGGLTYTKQFEIHIQDVNETPSDIALNANEVEENSASGTFIGRFSTTDVDAGDTFTYALVSGDGSSGNASFEIVGDELRTLADLDFETKKLYLLRVQVTDAGSNTRVENFTVSVTDGNDKPTDLNLSNFDFYENNEIGDEIAVISVTDQDATDTYVYSLVGVDDDSKFEIIDEKLIVSEVIDYETDQDLTITIRVTDDGGDGFTYDETFTLDINNRNEAPYEINVTNLVVAEDAALGTVIGTISAEDTDNAYGGESHTFTFNSGADVSGPFFIDGDELTISSKLDFETTSSYFITIQAKDVAGNTYAQQFEVTVTDVNEPPNDLYLSKNLLAEDAASGTFIGRLSVNDVDNPDTWTYAFVVGDGDADNGSFTIVNDELKSSGTYDYEVRNTYEVRIEATDQGSNTFVKTFIINITDSNDPPTDMELSKLDFHENNEVGQEVAEISVIDQDATDEYKFTLVGSDNDDFFEIIGNKLFVQKEVDYETNKELTLTIKVTDAAGEGFSYEEPFTFKINNVNEAPTQIFVTNLIVPEHQEIGTVIGEMTAEDSDSTFGELHTYAFATGEDVSGPFFIDGPNLELAEEVNFETKQKYFIVVTVTDKAQNTYTQQFDVLIENENDVPTALTIDNLEVDENMDAGTLVGTFETTDEDKGETFTYTLVEGVGAGGNASFTIENNELKTAEAFDFESTSSYKIRVRSTDSQGGSIEKNFVVTIVDANDAPTGLMLDNNDVDENLPEGTVIGVLSTDDTDAQDSFTYTLTGNDATVLNEYFKIVGDELQTATSLDAEAQSQYAIEVTVTDKGKTTFSESFVILINSVNETPVLLDTTFYVYENAEAGTSIGTLLGTDVDGDRLTYTFERNNPFFNEEIAAFNVVAGTGEVVVKTTDSLDYEQITEIIYLVTVTDSGSPELSTQALLRIELMDEVEPDILPVNEVITPNDDGYNDYFRVQNIQLYENYTLVIYSGSGIEVYRKGPYNNDWAGQGKNGDDLDPGVYYYKFAGPDGPVYRGTVTIIRD